MIRTGQPEPWIEVGSGGTAPAFENSWVNQGGTFDTAAFYKDNDGRVHLKGMVKSGATNTTIFTLPDNYKPALILPFPVVAASLFGQLRIFDNGLVHFTSGTATFVSLNGVSFRAA